jgi:ubiquinone/menaquinone biosynthesis C-methylase UbiE
MVIPTLGGLPSGARDAYAYLPDSTERFSSTDELNEPMVAAHFQDIQFEVLMFGAVAIHWAERR